MAKEQSGRITYRQLAARIAAMPDAEQDSDLTFFDTNDGEMFAVELVTGDEENNGSLDEGHPYFKLLNE